MNKHLKHLLCSAFAFSSLFVVSCGSSSSTMQEITIDNNEKTTFQMNVLSLDLVVGEMFDLAPKTYVSEEGLTWYSSARNIVTVNSDGRIEALDQGTAVISAYDSIAVGSITVTVSAANSKLSIELSVNQITIGIGEDYSYRVKAEALVNGENRSDINVNVAKKSESSEGVASYTREGSYFKFVGAKEGTAVFSFTATNQGETVGKNLYITVVNAD